MNLAIFDIDGTVVNSTTADDECFIQTFQDLYQIDLSGADWNTFEHVTDSGLTNQIFQESWGKLPEKHELLKIQDHFFNLLYERRAEFQEIPGVSEFLQELSEIPDISIAFATGGWRKTARLKLQSLKFNSEDLIIRTADDHFKRTEITKLAISDVKKYYNLVEADSITYFGDGLWDLTASKALAINFVGVDFKRTGKLVASGAKTVISDYLGADQSLLTKKAGG